jgi:hypothetical protein
VEATSRLSGMAERAVAARVRAAALGVLADEMCSETWDDWQRAVVAADLLEQRWRAAVLSAARGYGSQE